MNDYIDIKTWHKDLSLKQLEEKLQKRNFKTVIFDSIQHINDYIMNTIPPDAGVGLGGSVTLRELQIDCLLKERGNTVYDHWAKGKKAEEIMDIRKKQLTSDYFLTSVNAITAEGQIVNIDGAGNRVASMIFGPKHVIAIVSANKIVKNIDEALWRIKNIAAPQNSKRLNMETPCASKGYCVDCKTPKSVCRVTTIIDYRPMLTDFTVILTPLELGF